MENLYYSVYPIATLGKSLTDTISIITADERQVWQQKEQVMELGTSTRKWKIQGSVVKYRLRLLHSEDTVKRHSLCLNYQQGKIKILKQSLKSENR